jgi:MFS family permease
MTSQSDYTRTSIPAMGGLCLSGFLLFGVGVYSFTQFLQPLASEFGWGRAGLGGLMSAFWLSAPFAVPAAYLLPRLGVRKVVLIGSIIEAICLAIMVVATQQWQFMALRFGMGVGKVFIATPLPVMAAQWFPRRPALAVAISLCGWHCGGLVMAPLTAELIPAVGWREAAIILAIVLFIGMLFATYLLRDPRSRQAHYALPNNTFDRSVEESVNAVAIFPLTVVVLATIAFYAGYAGMLAQLSPLLADCGFDPDRIGKLTGSVAICAAVGVLVSGGITQLLPVRSSGTIALLLMAITAAAATLLSASSPGILVIGVVTLLGALIGGGDPIFIDSLRQCVPSRYFDRAYGWWYVMNLTVLSLSPLLTGLVYDRTGSYRIAFLVIAGACIAAMALWAACLRLPRAQGIAAASSA